MNSRTWTDAEIKALGARCDVETAGSILGGLSRTQTYEAVRAGRFPVPVISVGRRLIVPTAPIRRLLEMDEGGPEPPGPPSTSADRPSPRSTTTRDTTSAA